MAKKKASKKKASKKTGKQPVFITAMEGQQSAECHVGQEPGADYETGVLVVLCPDLSKDQALAALHAAYHRLTDMDYPPA